MKTMTSQNASKLAGPAVGEKESSTIFRQGQSVVFVGNGYSALRSRQGSQIDGFDVVVRFNRFKLAPYEEQVGTKTDVWCRNVGPQGGSPQIAIRSGAQALLLASNYARPERDQRLIAELSDKFPRCEVISREVLDYVRGKMGGIEPSSGMLAVTHALRFVDPVYTLGFDSMAPGQHHYFEAGEASPRSGHSPEAEAGYFRALQRSGAVIELREEYP
jgi:hypothetical protein